MVKKTLTIILLLTFAGLSLAAEFYSFPKVMDFQAKDVYLIRRPGPGFVGYTGTRNLTGSVFLATFLTPTSARIKALQTDLDGKSSIGHGHTIPYITGLQAVLDNKVETTDPRLSDARTPLAHNQAAATITGLAAVATLGTYSSLTGKPTIPAAPVNADWNASSGLAQILNKPALATVATSGAYADLSGKPTIPAAPVNADWSASSGLAQILNKPALATVATSGSYLDLSNTPPGVCEPGGPFDGYTPIKDVDYRDGIDGAPGAPGEQGPPGPANTLAIGTVTTIDYGGASAATITGASPNQTLNLVLVQGPPGQNASVTKTAVISVLNDPGGDTIYLQPLSPQNDSTPRLCVRDTTPGNVRWCISGDGTMFSQDTNGYQRIKIDPATYKIEMRNASNVLTHVLDSTGPITFKGTVTIQ